MSRGRGRRRFRMESHPQAGTCELCEFGPERGPMFTRRGRLYHRACWNAEKE